MTDSRKSLQYSPPDVPRSYRQRLLAALSSGIHTITKPDWQVQPVDDLEPTQNRCDRQDTLGQWSEQMNRVTVEVPEVDEERLVGEVTTTGPVSRFFSGSPFTASYSTAVEDVPAHIRTIPVLAHVCPVAWATGADVVVETVDANFLKGLEQIRQTLLEMYPEFMRGGSVICTDPVREERAPGERAGSGVLFTGGVDSTATYVRHREQDPTLVSVRGWVVGEDESEDERWERTSNYVSEFASERGHDAAFVESNMLSFLAIPLLQAHFQQYVDGAWYSSVGHGLGLLGLCAPMAYAEDWSELYIAASHTPDWEQPWGSDPDIDDHVQWSPTRCSHDGYQLTRQEKLDRIATYADLESPALPLRTCTHDDGAGNCSACEKCYRTIVGLLFAGLDPNDHGYEFDDGTFTEIEDYFESGNYLTKTTVYHWEVLQDVGRERSFAEQPGGEAFLEWLDEQDFAAFLDASRRPLGHRVVQKAARNTPTPVYAALYPVYNRITRAIR